MSPGLNLFDYAEDSSSEEETIEQKEVIKTNETESTHKQTETIPHTKQIEQEQEQEKKQEVDTKVEHKSTETNTINERKRVQPTENKVVEQAHVKVSKTLSTQSIPVQNEDEAKQWMAVLDPNSNRYYYWNQVTNVTTWECPKCLLQTPKKETKSDSSLKQETTIVSSGVTFRRCKVCGGWGKNLVRSSGMCLHCERLSSGKKQSQSVTQPASQYASQYASQTTSQYTAQTTSQYTAQTTSQYTAQPTTQSTVHSHAADVFMMQPKLRMYKKRPECNIPLSRRGKQKWETNGSDPLSIGFGGRQEYKG